MNNCRTGEQSEGNTSKSPTVVAIVAAGGSGSRMGFDKLTAPLGGVPVLARAVALLRAADAIGEIVVAAPAARMADYAALLAGIADVRVVPGGATRQQSVARAFLTLAPAPDFVCIHDGARPLATLAVVERVLAAASKDVGAVAAVRMADTLKRADEDGRVAATVPCEGLWAVQTPQVFSYEAYARALAWADDLADYTDDCGLFEAAGLSVRLVEGDPRNVKLTVAADFALAEALGNGQ